MCFILSSFNRKDGSVLSCFSGFESSRKCHASTDDASTHKGSVGYQPRYASALNFVVNDMESCSVSHKLVLKIFARSLSTYGVITQLGECLPCKQEVEGSNPFGSTSTDSKPFFCIKKECAICPDNSARESACPTSRKSWVRSPLWTPLNKTTGIPGPGYFHTVTWGFFVRIVNLNAGVV